MNRQEVLLYLVLPFVLLSTVWYVGNAQALECDYLYLRQADWSPIADNHIFKASSDYYGGLSFSDNPNGCRSDEIIDVIDNPIYQEEFYKKYGKMKGIWSAIIVDGETEGWELIKMRGVFSHWMP